MIGNGSGQQRKGSYPENLPLLFDEGDADTNQQCAHSVHQSRAEGPGYCIQHVPVTGGKQIVSVFQKGYKLGDKIIRYAMVTVAN